MSGCRATNALCRWQSARRIFDLGADPLQIAEHLRRCPALADALTAAPGLRVPGAWDGFELAVRAVLGQQASVTLATTLAGRLVKAFCAPSGLPSPAPIPFGRWPRRSPVESLSLTPRRDRMRQSRASAPFQGSTTG